MKESHKDGMHFTWIPGKMELSPTSSPYPAKSCLVASAGFGDEWEKPIFLENHVQCILCTYNIIVCQMYDTFT